MDKNEIIVQYLLECPALKPFRTYFNFGTADDNFKHFIAKSTDTATDKSYIDGSVLKRFAIDIVDFKSIGYNAIIKQAGYTDENVSDMFEVQQIIDWIEEQEDAHNYPDFGEKCQVQRMWVTTNEPNLNKVDTSVTPALAVYKVTLNIEYLDTSKCIWGK